MSAGEVAEEARAEAGRWLAIADRDLAAAEHCLSAKPKLLGIAAYHCQQAAEKLLKSVLIARRIGFPKTHDLVALVALAAPAMPGDDSLLKHIEPITLWGFAYRYPMEEDGDPEPAAEEIARAIRRLARLRRRVLSAIGPET